MAYTFAALYQEVGNQFDSQANTGTRVKDWTVDAVEDILSMRRWSCTETLATVASVSGQQDYVVAGASAIIPDFDGIISVKHNTAAASTFFPKLSFLPQPQFDELFGTTGAAAGVPAIYTLRGTTPAASSAAVAAGGTQVLSVFPVMNYIGSFKIAYYRNFGSMPMSADSDIPPLPFQFRQAIVMLAVSRGKAATDQLIASNVAMQIATANLQQLEQADIAARGGDPEERDLPTPPLPGRQPGLNPYTA